ncbi:MAG: lytic transglycosylase domain-containing protein, partial [Pseudomonadota bacterium]|nr:lytic transglycosylase domain-containing protein [Pseudomonadota bacterium]
RTPERAQGALAQLSPRLTEQQRGELQRALALGFALDRNVDALDIYSRLPDAVLDDRAREWRVRAALWHRRFDQAYDWLQRMPPAQAAEPRWTYWRARCLQLLGRDSRALYESLTSDNSYYGLMAAHRLQRGYEPRARSFVDDTAIQKRLMQQLGFVRAQELFLLGDRERWANLEWARATRDLDAAQSLQAARLASQWGWHIQAVGLLARQSTYDLLELSYPDSFIPPISAAARDLGMPANWLYGLMRQESLFNPRAQSPSNAYGLLQLLLPTAREVAKRSGRARPDVDALFRPEVNIPLGATYLREMRDRFDGQFAPATAAYNAGPNAVRRWLPAEPVEADIWIENIPYNETRGYVQKVMWNFAVRGWRSEGKPQDPSALLRPVQRSSP